MFKIISIIAALCFILNTTGTSGTSNTGSVTLPSTNSFSNDFQKLAQQVEILHLKMELNKFSLEKDLTALKTAIIQEIREHRTANKTPMEDCANNNPNEEQLRSRLVQEFAELKLEMVENIRASTAERQCNLSDHQSNLFENKIRSSLSASVKGEIGALVNDLSVRVKSDMENVKNIISGLKNDIRDLRNSLPPIRVESEIEQMSETIQPRINTTAHTSQEQGKFEESFQSSANKSQDESAQPYESCVVALQNGKDSGVYKLQIPSSGLEPFDVYCLKDPDNDTAWTVLQRRQDGSVDFYRNWQEYKIGFGNLSGEFFLGLEKWHALTTQVKPQQLWIEMVDWEGDKRSARYTTVQIGNESSKYNLRQLGQYSGDAGDSLNYHRGMKFSTKDSDNDADEEDSCATYLKGAWWFRKCHHSHLNGEYLRGGVTKESSWYGINWYHWGREFLSLKSTQMAIRPNY